MYNDFGFFERLLLYWDEVEAEFDFRMAQAAERNKLKKILAKPSPPYQLTPRGCGLVEERLCDNTNK